MFFDSLVPNLVTGLGTLFFAVGVVLLLTLRDRFGATPTQVLGGSCGRSGSLSWAWFCGSSPCGSTAPSGFPVGSSPRWP